MAKRTGGGFTKLPPDKHALEAKLDRSRTSFAREEDTLGDDLFVLILENVATGEVRGTCPMFTRVGQLWPFYSYRLGTLPQHSAAIGRPFRADMRSEERRVGQVCVRSGRSRG